MEDSAVSTRTFGGHTYTDCWECGLPLGKPGASHVCSRKCTIEWLCDLIETARVELSVYHERCRAPGCPTCKVLIFADALADVRFAKEPKMTLPQLVSGKRHGRMPS